MNELREKLLDRLADASYNNEIDYKLYLILREIVSELTSLVDKPKVDTGELKECPTCGKVKESKPTPDGDEICPCCGDKEMVDYEVTQTPKLEEHDEALLREFVDFLPKEFWEDEDHAVGGYISKKDLKGKVADFITSRRGKPTTDLEVDNSGEGE